MVRVAVVVVVRYILFIYLYFVYTLLLIEEDRMFIMEAVGSDIFNKLGYWHSCYFIIIK